MSHFSVLVASYPKDDLFNILEPLSHNWDWWQIGGRFEGLLLTDGIRCNSAPVKDVDFSVDKLEYTRALRIWDLLIEEAAPQTPEEEELILYNLYSPEYFIKTYGNKENYAMNAATFNTYAYINPEGTLHWLPMNDDLYENYIKDLDGDIILTLIDCHI